MPDSAFLRCQKIHFMISKFCTLKSLTWLVLFLMFSRWWIFEIFVGNASVSRLLSFPHRQVVIEKVFPVDAAMEIRSLKETCISLRIMYDIIKFACSNKIKASVSSTRSKCMPYLEKKKKENELNWKFLKKKKISTEFTELIEIDYLNK